MVKTLSSPPIGHRLHCWDLRAHMLCNQKTKPKQNVKQKQYCSKFHKDFKDCPQVCPCATTTETHALQSLRSTAREATATRSPSAAAKSSPHLPQLRKLAQSNGDPVQPKINKFFLSLKIVYIKKKKKKVKKNTGNPVNVFIHSTNI